MKTLFTVITLSLSISTYYAQDDNESWKLFPGKKVEATPAKKDTNTVVFGEQDTVKTKIKRIGYVEIVQEEKTKELLARYNRINEEKQTIEGYRIQLFSGSGANVKTEANKVKADFLKLYDGIDADVDWDPPIWKTRVGNFRTRLEAEKFLLMIQEDFPNSFVVKDEIEFPPLED